jgi:hypothetical protein
VSKEIDMNTLTRWVALIVAVVAASAVTFAQGPLNVLQVDYTCTEVNKATGETKVIEQGSYLLAPDGRQRIEHNKNGVRSVEILDAGKGQRITLDPATKLATLTSMRALPPNRPGVVPFQSPPQTQRQTVALGTKAVAGLLLEGSRQTLTHAMADGTQVTHVVEFWSYGFTDRHIMPALLELRFEDDHVVDERTITDVSTVPGSEALFQVPAGFAVK